MMKRVTWKIKKTKLNNFNKNLQNMILINIFSSKTFKNKLIPIPKYATKIILKQHFYYKVTEKIKKIMKAF